MQRALSLLLASILVIPAIPVSAEDVAAKPTLEERPCTFGKAGMTCSTFGAF